MVERRDIKNNPVVYIRMDVKSPFMAVGENPEIT